MKAKQHKRQVFAVTIVAVVLAALLLPGLSQAMPVEPPAAMPVAAAVAEPVGTPTAAALLQAWPTPTNTLTVTQQLQALEQQMHAAYNASDWALVLSTIDEIRAIDSAYKAAEILDIEYHAHVAYGWDLMLEGKCLEALDEFRAALLIKPDDEEATQGLDAVAKYCKTPVPGQTATATPPSTYYPPGGTITYVVQLGDTLYGISVKFGVSVEAIMAANGLSNYNIWAGQVLYIPSPYATPVATATPHYWPTATPTPPYWPTATPQQPVAHLVRPGETLCSLARQYDTNIWAIMAYNHLYTTTIYANTILYIPVGGQGGVVSHVVQRGETLYSLSRAYNTSVAAIMSANGLSNFNIYAGQTLIIPSGSIYWYPGYPTSDPCGGSPYSQTYVVKLGDTLSGIAQRFGVSVYALKAANNLTGDMIYAGTVLYIP